MLSSIINVREASMDPRSSVVGIELIGDLKHCDKSLLSTVKAAGFLEFLLGTIDKYGLTEVDNAKHDFDKGFTAIIALAESHVAVHTWPDEGYVSVNVHVCNYSRDNTSSAESLYRELCEHFKAEKVDTHRIIRTMA